MKAETDKLYTIFLLKKNVQINIIKMILGYLPIAALEILQEQKVAITLVGQRYKSTKSQQDYKIETETTYRERGILMNIKKTRENFDKDGKPKCFNYNIYKHIVKKCRKPKKKQDIRKYYKCNKVEHIAKDYRLEQKMKNYSIKKSDNKKKNNQKGFGKGSEQAQYEESLYIMFRIDMLFQTKEITKRES